jgi:hypothetical protein
MIIISKREKDMRNAAIDCANDAVDNGLRLHHLSARGWDLGAGDIDYMKREFGKMTLKEWQMIRQLFEETARKRLAL